MSILVVGADNLGNIAEKLKVMGYKCLTHLKGRKNVHKRSLKIPVGTDLVLVMIDYVDHNIALSIKDNAKRQSIPVVFSKRSWAYISKQLEMVEGLV